jgi:c-di-GMP-binding flagellar brake protein YcgR
MVDVSSADNELSIQDRVLVEAEAFGREISFRAMIVKICPDELWLGLASPDHRLETMRPDQQITLTVARSGAALVGPSGFLRPLGGSKSRIFAVVRPAVLERVQRRSHARYQAELPIHFRHVDPATRELRGKSAGGRTINVSPGGMLFLTEVHASIGEELDLTVPLSGTDRISMIGVVTRTSGPLEDTAGGDGVAATQVAVRFTRITAVDQERMVKFILLTEHRRREATLRAPDEPAPGPTPAQVPAQVPVSVPAAVQSAAPATLARAAAALAARDAALAARAATAAAPSAPATPAPRPEAPRPEAPRPDPDQPLIAQGLRLCEASEARDVRHWFDSLMPFDRIELLSMLQANMAGGAVPGAAEPASVRPLAIALGLLAA